VKLRGQDTARLSAALVALGISALLAVGLAFVSSTVNRPPVIESVEAQPAVLARDGSGTLRVKASDPDGDALRFEYAAETGRVTPDKDRPQEARYLPAADGPLADRVTVTVRDGRGLASSRSALFTLDAPAPTPTEGAETATPAPAPIALITPLPTRAPPRAAPRRTRAPVAETPEPPPAAAPRENHPPVLDGGYSTAGIGKSTITLMATGHDPDNESVTYEWEAGGCFEIVRQSQTEADVKFIDECKMGTVTLTWSDPQGASASTRWILRR
jgi:hypothetical protein